MPLASKWNKDTPVRAHRVAWAWLAFVALVCAALPLRAATVTATVNRPVITFGETVTLTISVKGGRLNDLQLPALPNFEVVGRGNTFQFADGQVEQGFTFELSPTQPGDLRIPAMQLNVNGQASTTQPIILKVLKSGQAAGGAPPAAFARIAMPKTNLFVGEVVMVDVQVYLQEGRLTQYPQLPTDPGFTLGKWLKPTDTRVLLSNVAYTLVTFRAPLTAVKAGALTVGPVTQSVVVPDRGRRSFFFQSEREVKAMGDQVHAVALPLPTNNVPKTFAGAVGQYSVNMTASPTKVAVGDPITVRVQITGRGWLDALNLPNQPQWREFKTYAPNVTVESADENHIQGTKTFEIAMVPQNPAIATLPSFSFAYFDPDAGGYRTAATPPIALTIAPSAAPSVPLPRLTATNSTAPQMSDIAHIKVHLGTVTAPALLISRPWFIGLQLIAPALWLGLLVRRKRSDSLANNPRLRRRREVHSYVRENLAKLRAEAAANNSDGFFAILVRLLQEQIGERLDVPANSVTEAIIAERLRPGGLPEGTRQTLDELFQAANLARYAPVKSSQELAALVAKTEKVLHELQSWEAAR